MIIICSGKDSGVVFIRFLLNEIVLAFKAGDADGIRLSGGIVSMDPPGHHCCLTGQRPHQCGFTRSVGADHCPAVTDVNRPVDIFQQPVAADAQGNIVEIETYQANTVIKNFKKGFRSFR